MKINDINLIAALLFHTNVGRIVTENKAGENSSCARETLLQHFLSNSTKYQVSGELCDVHHPY